MAKKYHVDFALKKDTTAEQPRYLVFFKSRDADAITAAFQEFSAGKLHRKPSIRQRLAPGEDFSARLIAISEGFSAVFSNVLPSFTSMDLLLGVAGLVFGNITLSGIVAKFAKDDDFRG